MTLKISLEKLLETGAHFGHQVRRWNPKIKEYIYGEENGVHVFDLIKTGQALEAALEVLKKAYSEGKLILFVGTKKQAKEVIKNLALKLSSPYVCERWLGGTFTNFDQIARSVKTLSGLKTGLTSGEFDDRTKKERLLIQKQIDDLERKVGGLTTMTRVPDMMVVVDTHRENGAITEAIKMGVVTIAIVDSNSDPEKVNYPIPMNDDSAKAVEYVLALIESTLLASQAKSAKAAKDKAN